MGRLHRKRSKRQLLFVLARRKAAAAVGVLIVVAVVLEAGFENFLPVLAVELHSFVKVEVVKVVVADTFSI